MTPGSREVVMNPPPFSYAAPTTLAEAVGLLAEHADVEARVLAGGPRPLPPLNFPPGPPGHPLHLANRPRGSGDLAGGGGLGGGGGDREVGTRPLPAGC